jgi:hypothetical protein
MSEKTKQGMPPDQDLRTMQEVRNERGLTRIRELPISQISDFPYSG